ncbi:MAG: hypothetical protein IJU62_08485 [Muribaculaceae bacterium]|nr:hypothetical protein [Muribaculaceae bacterium]
MITIGKPFVYDDGVYAYLKAKVEISQDTVSAYIAASHVIEKVHWRTHEDYPPKCWQDENSGLWFAVPLEYKDGLCADRGDAFVASFLWYAMITGSDIKSEAPLSQQMVFNIKRFLIPALCTDQNGYRRIDILGETTSEPVRNAAAVGTGMSCGVDSFYTANQYVRPDTPSRYRLTHLCYFNMGAIFHPDRQSKKEYTVKEFYDTTDRMSEEKRDLARQVADQSNMPLVYVKSNLDSDYYRGAYGHTGVYRNCAMALSLQGLFSVYYNSSGGWPGYFDLTLTEGSQHYEALLCQCLSTESLAFILSDYTTRFEKTAVIADDKLAQKYLDVCFRFNNCGTCSKCIRTLVTLEILGKLDQFADVFNIDYFKKHRAQAYYKILLTKSGDAKDDDAVFTRDLYKRAKEKNLIPFSSYLKYWLVTILGINKIKKGAKHLAKRVLSPDTIRSLKARFSRNG